MAVILTPIGTFRVRSFYTIRLSGLSVQIFQATNLIHTITVKGADAALNLESRAKKWIALFEHTNYGYSSYQTNTEVV